MAKFDDTDLKTAAEAAATRSPYAGGKILPPVKQFKSPQEVAAALREMDRVKRGGSPLSPTYASTFTSTSGGGVITPTPEQALKVIVDAVRDSKDPRKSAGKWITKFTNEVLEVIKDLDDEG